MKARQNDMEEEPIDLKKKKNLDISITKYDPYLDTDWNKWTVKQKNKSKDLWDNQRNPYTDNTECCDSVVMMAVPWLCFKREFLTFRDIY